MQVSSYWIGKPCTYFANINLGYLYKNVAQAGGGGSAVVQWSLHLLKEQKAQVQIPPGHKEEWES
jgi:hypothetical protein